MKDWANKCVAIIPCLNEQGRIGPVVTMVRSHIPQVCVIDDGSADDTAQVAADAGAHVLRSVATCGKGRALRIGWRYALDQQFSWVLMLDGDGQHSAQDIPTFLQAAEETGADLVIGNRMQAKTRKMPLVRRFVNRWMSRRISKRTGVDLPDTQCGFRLLRLHSVELSAVDADHYEIESDLLLQVLQQGRRVVFVPIRVVYGAEQSKINPLVDTIRWFRWWSRGRKQRDETDCHKPEFSRSSRTHECG